MALYDSVSLLCNPAAFCLYAVVVVRTEYTNRSIEFGAVLGKWNVLAEWLWASSLAPECHEDCRDSSSTDELEVLASSLECHWDPV